MNTYEQVQFQVGAWATENFGNNPTPYLTARGSGDIDGLSPRKEGECAGVQLHGITVTELGSLAPLMGITEEHGELIRACMNHNNASVSKQQQTARADIVDALGDMAIYLCDYLCREGISWPAHIELLEENVMQPAAGVVVYLGELYHCHLKRHQRIRGMHDRRAFEEARMNALICFIWHLQHQAYQLTSMELLTILNDTWDTIVKKRDWTKAPQDGDVQ